MTEDELLSKRMSDSYNCCHFLCDAWEYRTGKRALDSFLLDFLNPRKERTATLRIRNGCFPSSPVSPCIVLFRRSMEQPHVGLFENGSVLHLTRKGAIRQPLHLARLGYRSVRFYAVR